MIKTNEYREGNYFKWSEIASMGLGVDIITRENHYHYNQLRDDIPLTEDWLLKFGFVKSWSCMDYDRYNKEGFNMLKDYGEQCIKLPRDKGGYIHLNCGYYDNEIDFDYVHQLQNLYFALCGTELEIK